MKFRDNEYQYFAQYIFKHTGIEYGENDYYRLDSRMDELMAKFKFANSTELISYCSQNQTDQKLHGLLVDLFTNNETYFLRDVKLFKSVIEGVVNKLTNQKEYNVWSCACSTGQEIFSFIMSLEEFTGQVFNFQLNVDASDISNAALDKAKSGIYTNLEANRGLTQEQINKYFDENEKNKSWKLKDRILNKVNFYNFNLLSDSYHKNKYDLIFCRNVLIYQNQANKTKILKSLYSSLKTGGYIVFGAGESLMGLDVEFKQMQIEGSWFYKKE